MAMRTACSVSPDAGHRRDRNRRSARQPAPAWPARRAPTEVRLPPGRVSTTALSAASMPRTGEGSASLSTASSGAKGEGAASPMVTQRSCQTPPCRTICRTGSASMNSLAMTMSGPCGTSRSCRTSAAGQGSRAASARCVSRSTGLVSIRAIDMLSSNLGTLRHARSASAISVPRPAPSSATVTTRGLAHGLPDRCAPHADQLAEHLADLRRGDEVAVFADRLARRVIARAPVGEASFHIVVHADRTVAGNPLAQPGRKRRGHQSRGAYVARPSR